MEFSYNDLRQMDVVSVSDGRNLGRVCDLLFDFPEGRVRGFYVTGCKGFRLTRQDIFIPLKSVVRIGEDVILTEADDIPPPKKPCRKPRRDCCQPDFSQNCDDRNCAPKDRRSYDEYE